jgi:hypothetical protein
MSNTFYVKAMRAAPVILFAITVALLVLGILASTVLNFGRGAGQVGLGPMLVLEGIWKTLADSGWPFFGAVFLWRMDKWLERNQ